MTELDKAPSKWRARKLKAAKVRGEKRTRGDAIRQAWADSRERVVIPEPARAGAARVPHSLRVDRPEPTVLVEVGPGNRDWYRQQTRDAFKRRRKAERQARRNDIAARMPTETLAARQRKAVQ